MAPKDLKLTSPVENTPEQCDLYLGAYLRTWDQVEMQLLPLFSKLLGTHQNATLVLMRVGIDQPTLREILESLAVIRLSEIDQSALGALLARWKKASSKRNRIVHASWVLHIKMIPGPSGKRDHTKAEWRRFYSPSNSAVLHKIMTDKDQKLTAAHWFTLASIEQAAKDVHKLSRDLDAFHERIKVRNFVTPQPIELEQ